MNLQHLHLHVRDRATSERFYAKWMGLRVARRGSALTFMSDELGFDLALMDDAAPAAMPPWFRLGFKLLLLCDEVRSTSIVSAAWV